jgi:hypothetical protein
VEEIDLVCLPGDCCEGTCRCDGAGQCICSETRSENTDTVASVGILDIVVDTGVEIAASRSGADPVAVRGSETERGRASVAFKATIREDRYPFVAARECDLEAALSGVCGRRSIRGDKVL